MAEYLQVLTTVESPDDAGALARSVVEGRFAACVQVVGPVRSVYYWEDAIEDAQEWLLLMKTTAARFPALEEHIKANHSYDVPEIIASPITAGSAEYLSWVSVLTGSGD